MPAALSGRDGGAKGGRKVNPTERGEEVCGARTGELLWPEWQQSQPQGRWPGQAHGAPRSEGPCAWCTAFLLSSWNSGTKSPHCHFATGPAKYESVRDERRDAVLESSTCSFRVLLEARVCKACLPTWMVTPLCREDQIQVLGSTWGRVRMRVRCLRPLPQAPKLRDQIIFSNQHKEYLNIVF